MINSMSFIQPKEKEKKPSSKHASRKSPTKEEMEEEEELALLRAAALKSKGAKKEEPVQVVGYLLTHCGLVKPYGNKDLGQHWLR